MKIRRCGGRRGKIFSFSRVYGRYERIELTLILNFPLVARHLNCFNIFWVHPWNVRPWPSYRYASEGLHTRARHYGQKAEAVPTRVFKFFACAWMGRYIRCTIIARNRVWGIVRVENKGKFSNNQTFRKIL